MGRRGNKGTRTTQRPDQRSEGSSGRRRASSDQPGGGAKRGAPHGEADTSAPRTAAPPPMPVIIDLPEAMTVRDLARSLRVNPIDVIKELMANGIVVSINQTIDYETAEIVAAELGFETRPEQLAQPEAEEGEEEEKAFGTLWQKLADSEDKSALKPRPPVVTVLGHVDHGKTTLLDAIRHTSVVSGEYGGITQHIGAYQVEHDGRKITFLDTPGHEAFTAMRARGAQVTDLAVLVVAADDGVMPQTREAIAHARAAGVPILVALNKIDKASAHPDRVKQQLSDAGLVVEEWGGDVVAVPVSALTHRGIEELLDNILLVTELSIDPKSNPDRPAVGTVVEAQLDAKRGSTATLLVQGGTLQVGDALVIGPISGRVRAMFDHRGEPVRAAPPAMPVLVLGLSDVPKAGDIFRVVESEREARDLAEDTAERQRIARARPARARTLSLEEVFSRFEEGDAIELNLILKADVQGSLEPIVNSIERLGGKDQKVTILHQGIGQISESDVMLAAASDAVVIGFHVDVDEAARRMAVQEGVDIRQYNIIYKLIDDVDLALKGMLEPVYEKVVIGHADVRAVFTIRRRGNVAGCYVTDGVVTRNASARVLRDGEELFDGHLSSLKRFQEDVTEVRSGFECGIAMAGFDDFEEGDTFEFYREERVA
ncbi:MAG: translation initiation factor IF-2 [Anaerolineae bacterium]|nr:translation initiation factor IF-2 [Anaerolineae bacterium]